MEVGKLDWQLREKLENPQSLYQIKSSQLCSDWHGVAINPVVNYGLAADSSDLAVWAWRSKAPFLKFDLNCGQYFEGLWNQDVIELFIDINCEGHYVEFNLSPQGAWWFQHFEGYRVRTFGSSEKDFNQMRCFSAYSESFWAVAAILPKKYLECTNRNNISLETVLKCNFCTILYNNKGVEHYVSASLPPVGAVPDFHLQCLRKTLF